jgi:PAS domain S-box-containing protein
MKIVTFRSITFLFSLVAILIAILGLLGYLPHLRVLGSISKSYVPMAPSTALCFIIISSSVLYINFSHHLKKSYWFIIFLLAVAIVFGGGKFIEYIVGNEISFEQKLLPDMGYMNKIPLGIMSPATGAAFFLDGIALFALFLNFSFFKRNIWLRYCASSIALFVMLVSFVFCLAYFYGAPLLYNQGPTVPMALTTALGFMSISMGIIVVSGKEVFPLNLLLSKSTNSLLLRFILPLTTLSVFMGGIAALASESYSGIDSAVTMALTTVVTAVLAGVWATVVSRHMGNVIDKSEQQIKSAMKQLADSQENMRVTLNSIGDAVIATDIDTKITRMNPVAEVLTGWDFSEAEGKRLYEVFNIIDLSTRNTEIIPALGRMDDYIGGVKNSGLVSKDGKEYKIAYSGAPILNRLEEIIGMVLVFRDVTAEEEAKEQLEAALVAAQAGSTAKSEFLATMSHEIRTPLNGIIGFSDIVQSQLKQLNVNLPEDIINNLEIVKKCGFDLKELINDILELSCIEAGKLNEISEAFSPGELLLENARILDLKAEQNEVILNINSTDLPLKVVGCKRFLKQIIFNLVGNAVKFTNCGNVDVFCECRDGKLLIKVVDSGIGIPDDMLNEIKKPFTQVDQSVTRKYGGTGLGLTIVSRILEHFGEKLDIRSKLGEGTTVGFAFPVEVVDAKEAENGTTEKLLNTFDKALDVLIIEDDEASVMYLETLLSDKNVSCKTARSYSEMLKVCENFIPDIALVDIGLPGANGFACLNWLKEKYADKQVKYVAQTANVLQEDVKKYKEAGFDDFIGKPYTKDQLLQIIN